MAFSFASYTSGVVYSPLSPPLSFSDGDNYGRFDGNMDGELVSSLGGRDGSFEDEGDNEGVDVTLVGDNEGVDVTLAASL